MPATGSSVDYATLVRDDRIHASLYTDPRIFADELERIFHRGWAGRTTHRLRRLDGALRMSRKTVVLVNAAEPLPNLAFLI